MWPFHHFLISAKLKKKNQNFLHKRKAQKGEVIYMGEREIGRHTTGASWPMRGGRD